jgi:hypothetical protein
MYFLEYRARSSAGRGFDSRWCHIFQWYNPAGRTVALGSTQRLTEKSTRCISGGKGGRCVRLTTLPPSCAVVKKSGNLNFLEPSGPPQACNGTALPLPLPLLLRIFRNCKVRATTSSHRVKFHGMLHTSSVRSVARFPTRSCRQTEVI